MVAAPSWVRIAFNPYSDMKDWASILISTDLVVDVLVFLNLLLCFNVAYMNKKSRWVVDR